MAKRTLKNMAIMAGIAAAAGFVAGLLTAPKSGKETRDDIKSATKRGLSEAEKQLKALSAELGSALDDAKSQGKAMGARAGKQLDDLTDRANVAREKVREMISAVHEGDAEDEDLQTAMHQARRALDHLKEYLKK